MGRQRHRGKERKRKSAREEGGERGMEIEPATQSELAPRMQPLVEAAVVLSRPSRHSECFADTVGPLGTPTLV